MRRRSAVMLLVVHDRASTGHANEGESRFDGMRAWPSIQRPRCSVAGLQNRAAGLIAVWQAVTVTPTAMLARTGQ